MFQNGMIKTAIFALLAGALVAAPASAAGKKPFFEQNIERWGADYSVFAIAKGGANACYQACAKDKVCLAWTYQKEGTGTKSGHCHLKSKVSHPKPNECCVSGVLIGQSSLSAAAYKPVTMASLSGGERKAVKARRSKKASMAQRFFRKTSLDEGEAAGLPEMKAAAFAPPTQITPVSFDISEEF